MTMQKTSEHLLVLVTAPDGETAARLARALLESRLIACANVLPGVQSHYWWQGKIESSPEHLLLLKTTEARLETVEAEVLRLHPYDTPEVVAIHLDRGNAAYLAWLSESCQATRLPLPPGAKSEH